MAATGGKDLVLVKIQTESGVKEAFLDRSLALLLQSPSSDMETRQSIINAIMHEEETNSTSISTSSDKIEEKQPDNNGECTDYNNNDNKSLEVHTWKESEEKLLITLRGDRETLFNNSRNHDKLWEDIKQEMVHQNINVSKLQCMNKWKNLRKKYKEVIDNNSKSVSAPKTWKHVKAFNDLYGHKCSTRPEVVIDTSNKEKLITLPDDELSSEKSDSPYSSCNLLQQGPSRPKKRKVKQSDKEKLLQHIQKFDERQQQALEKFEQHHQQKMEKMDRLLNIFESVVKKAKIKIVFKELIPFILAFLLLDLINCKIARTFCFKILFRGLNVQPVIDEYVFIGILA